MPRFFNWIINQPYLLLTVAAIIWSGNAIAGKLAVGHISPALLTSLRWFVAVLVVLPFAMPHLKKDLAQIKIHLLFLFLLGSVGFAIFNNIMYLALNHTSAINVGIIQGAMPLIVFILNFTIFRIKTGILQLIGFSFTLLGIIITITGGNLFELINQTINFGDFIMLFAIIAYGGYSVALRNKPDIHWLSFICVLSISAFFTSNLFTMLEYQQGNTILPDGQAMLVVLFIAIFPSLISQTFWARGLELIGSNRGGVFINFTPIFGSIFSILLLGEDFKSYHALSLILVVGGVTLAQRK